MTVVKSLSAVVTDNDSKPPHRDKQHGYKKIKEANFDKFALFMGTFKAEDQEA